MLEQRVLIQISEGPVTVEMLEVLFAFELLLHSLLKCMGLRTGVVDELMLVHEDSCAVDTYC